MSDIERRLEADTPTQPEGVEQRIIAAYGASACIGSVVGIMYASETRDRGRADFPIAEERITDYEPILVEESPALLRGLWAVSIRQQSSVFRRPVPGSSERNAQLVPGAIWVRHQVSVAVTELTDHTSDALPITAGGLPAMVFDADADGNWRRPWLECTGMSGALRGLTPNLVDHAYDQYAAWIQLAARRLNLAAD